MKIEKKWSASSKIEKVGKGEELANMAGRWNVGIEVSITKPYIYSKGTVEMMIIDKKTYDEKSQSSFA